MAIEKESSPKTQVEQPKRETEKTVSNGASKQPVTMRQLLECGVHFGHQKRRWNPKMKPYIFTLRNDIHVIDLQKTAIQIKKAYAYLKNIAEQNGTVLFVGTKKQSQEVIETEAKRCKMPYVNQRWLGGTLTNHITIRQRINKLNQYEQDKAKGIFDKLSKKEASRRNKMLSRLHFYLDGVKDMKRHPDALFVIDTKNETLAIKEARKLKIPIIGLVDTNADPQEVDIPIPGNDDAIRAIKLICSVMANAIEDGSSTLDGTAIESNLPPIKSEAAKREQVNAKA